MVTGTWMYNYVSTVLYIIMSAFFRDRLFIIFFLNSVDQFFYKLDVENVLAHLSRRLF